jgi:hypothetical protein
MLKLMKPDKEKKPATAGARRLVTAAVAALAAGVAQTGWALADATVAEQGAAPATAEATTAPPSPMTADQIRAAIEDAEKRRKDKSKPDSSISGELAEKLADQWGVEVIGINLTSAGYMLDFRFRVVDADKALPLFDHRIKPYVLAERSNIKLPVPMAPKVGAFRPTNRGKNIKADKTYYMVFGNPDSHVKRGEKVTVVVGDFRAEHLTVR